MLIATYRRPSISPCRRTSGGELAVVENVSNSVSGMTAGAATCTDDKIRACSSSQHLSEDPKDLVYACRHRELTEKCS